MPPERPLATILRFPEKGEGRKHLALVPLRSDVVDVGWPPHALDGLEVPEVEQVQWLDDALVLAKVKGVSFLRALAQLPSTALSPEAQQGPLLQFHQVNHRLTLALELLRMGQVGEDELRALLPGLRRAWNMLRHLRQTLMEGLDARARAAVLSEEARSLVGPLDIERELQERSSLRTLGQDERRAFVWMPGGHLLEMPGEDALEQRRQREKRIEHDFRAVNSEQALADWLEELPQEWLEGIARRIGLPQSEDRWEQERRMCERLLNPREVLKLLKSLTPIERRILGQVVRDGFKTRYDHLILHYGADDETAWHWAEVVPTTPLERVRRCGLLFVGQCQMGRRAHRVAVIPTDLRDILARQLHRLGASGV